jgi:hypothetical protein
MEITWDIYLLLLLSLAAGYAMGIGSRLVIKAAMKDYIKDRMDSLNAITTSYTQKTQIQCDAMMEQANQEALKLYKEALYSMTPEVPVPDPEPTDLN